jgi:ribosomal protein L5
MMEQKKKERVKAIKNQMNYRKQTTRPEELELRYLSQQRQLSPQPHKFSNATCKNKTAQLQQLKLENRSIKKKANNDADGDAPSITSVDDTMVNVMIKNFRNAHNRSSRMEADLKNFTNQTSLYIPATDPISPHAIRQPSKEEYISCE